MLTSVNLEMPKYKQAISKGGLKLFVPQFNMWSRAKNLTDAGKKLYFSLAFSSNSAQNYFMIHNNDLVNDNLNFDDFLQQFIRDCPREALEAQSVLDILAQKQKPLEKASIHIQKMRAAVGDEFATAASEKDAVLYMMKGLHPNIQQYLQCQGPPETYEALMKAIRTYENSGLASSIPDALTPAPAIKAAVNNISYDDDDDNDPVNRCAKKVAVMLINQKPNDRFNQNGNRNGNNNRQQQGNQGKCFNCGRFGHRIAQCHQPRNGGARGNSNNNWRRGRGNNNYNQRSNQGQRFGQARFNQQNQAQFQQSDQPQYNGNQQGNFQRRTE